MKEVNYKKVSKSGGITIPQKLRHQLGYQAGVALALEVKEDGLHISKHIPTCMLCGSADNVTEIENFGVCLNCAKEIVGRFESGSKL